MEIVSIKIDESWKYREEYSDKNQENKYHHGKSRPKHTSCRGISSDKHLTGSQERQKRLKKGRSNIQTENGETFAKKSEKHQSTDSWS